MKHATNISIDRLEEVQEVMLINYLIFKYAEGNTLTSYEIVELLQHEDPEWDKIFDAATNDEIQQSIDIMYSVREHPDYGSLKPREKLDALRKGTLAFLEAQND